MSEFTIRKKKAMPTATSLVRWVAERLSSPQIAPRLRARPAARFPRLGLVQRARLAAWWDARSAVRSGARLEEFLRWRLAHYLGRLPLAGSELPAALAFEGPGELRGAPVLLAAELVDSSAERLKSQANREIALARREMAPAEVELDVLQKRVEEQTKRVETFARHLEKAVSDGGAAVRGAESATPEQLGRPQLARPWAIWISCALAGGLVLAETLHLAGPFLRMAGASGDLARELLQRPAEVAPYGVLALGATAALMVLARLALRYGARALEGGARGPAAAAVVGPLAAASAIAWALASMRAGAAFAALGLVMPFAAVWLLDHAERLAAARQPQLETARAWDEQYRTAMLERIRREELLERACEERDRLARARDGVQQAVALASRRAAEAERGQAAASAAQYSRLSRFANSLNAALERDRYAFIRQAASLGRRELVEAPRRAPLGAEPTPRNGTPRPSTIPPAMA